MDGRAIGAGAIGYAGLGMLTSDIGHTRLAEILRARRDLRPALAEPHGRTDTARATRP